MAKSNVYDGELIKTKSERPLVVHNSFLEVLTTIPEYPCRDYSSDPETLSVGKIRRNWREGYPHSFTWDVPCEKLLRHRSFQHVSDEFKVFPQLIFKLFMHPVSETNKRKKKQMNN